MPRPFKGIINVDIRDSVPDWEPYQPPRAPEGAPNVLMVVLDDVGYASMSCYGGPIETPTFDGLAQRGLQYTQWHTTALCSPTRSCLLTGRNHTNNGMACIIEGVTGFPGSNGHIPFENATLAEVLVERGYNTYALGKWHLCPEDEENLAATKRNWPIGRGFERYYGFLGGETSQWYPELVHDNHSVQPPTTPEEGYHLTEDLADRAIEFIREAKVIAPDKPFFAYFAPGACHAPHQVPREWSDRYKGRFDQGYEAIRQEIFERQRAMGIIPAGTELPPMDPLGTPETRTGPDGQPFPLTDFTRPWDSLSVDEKRLFARMAEVFAGFLSHTDYHVGRILDVLREMGELDNTIVVVVSDNGASAEGGPNGSVNENLFFNEIPDDMQRNLAMLDELGTTATYNHYSNGWAMAFNTPFKMWKRYCYNGGTCDACIISWPKGITARGERRDQYHHAIDIAPTLLDCLGIELPDAVKGYTQTPMDGTSMRYTFTDASAPSRRTKQFYSMLGSRGIYHEGWKADTTHPTVSGWGHFSDDTWELYHVAEDRSESRNLAEQHPDVLRRLMDLWYVEAGANNGLPIDDRTPVEVLGAPRPTFVAPRNRYIYFPGMVDIPEPVAVDTRNRSYTIGAIVDIADPDAHGVLFAMGSRFGGHVLFVKDRRLQYVYNFVGLEEQQIVGDADVPTGEKLILSASFVKDGEEPRGVAHGTLSLYINDRKVGEGRIKTQPGRYGLAGTGLKVGHDGAQSVSAAYQPPFAFTGGTIHRVAVDVSGTPYMDLEAQAAAMLRRT